MQRKHLCMGFHFTSVPIQPFSHPLLKAAGVHLSVLREDLNHPVIAGNKARKLVYNIEEARRSQQDTILTFGGAYSNHIRATSAAGRYFGFKTIGVIRGEEVLPLNPTLAFAVRNGMSLVYLDRSTYRRKAEKSVLREITQVHGPCYLLPEGGSNGLAVKGAAEIITQEILREHDVVCTACGTGGTLAGLVMGMRGEKRALGVAVLKGAGFLKSEVSRLLEEAGSEVYDNWDIHLDGHFGGYAKPSRELDNFLAGVAKLNPNIPLEPIYTGRLVHAILDRVRKGVYSPATRILMVHTGGIH